MDVLERFLTYVSFDTQSKEGTGRTPSTSRQLRLADHLWTELEDLGLEARRDPLGYVYARLEATPGQEQRSALGLIAHMDTSPSASGARVRPKVVRYQGEDIPLNPELGIVLSERVFPSLGQYLGQELVVTDGTTLLGADDKAGIAEIVTTVEYLVNHPQIPHGELWVAFTPDEEIGEGADHFDLEHFGANCAYTVDGGALGELEYENFNAASARIRFHGRSIHPGEAKGRMINALLMAVEYLSLLPPQETPAHTEGYEGFFHVHHIDGTEAEAEVRLLVRDHDRARFEARKDLLEALAQTLRSQYGAQRVEVELRDSYYNMREMIEPHWALIERARAAFEAVGVEPRAIPIRGGTDGARLSYMGLPCPNLSTGGVNFHGVYEYIPVESMEKMVGVLVELCRNWT